MDRYRAASRTARVVTQDPAAREPERDALLAVLAWAWPGVVVVLTVTLALMWPVVGRSGESVIGFESDPASDVWRLNEFDAGRLGLVRPATTTMANAPDGVKLRRPMEIATIAVDSISVPVVKAFGAVRAYNVLVASALVTNGLAMLVLARTLRFGRIAAAVSAAAFTAAPVLVLESRLHLSMAIAAPLPLVAAGGCALLARRSWRTAMLSGTLVGLTAYVNPYMPLYATVLLGAFLIVGVLRNGRSFLSLAATASIAAALLALPAMVVLATNHGEAIESTRRTVDEVRTFALDPVDQLEIFGSALAAVPVLLAACVGARQRHLRRYTPAFALAAAGGVLLALPPDVKVMNVRVPLPSRAAFEMLSIWRVVGRAMVLPLLALAVLLGAAVSALHDASARGRVAWTLLVLVSLVAWSGGAIDVGSPSFPVDGDPELTLLLAATPGRVAEYPLFGFDNAIGPYLVRQTRHGRPLLNGGIPGTVSAELAGLAAQPLDPQASTALVVAGVTRIVAHDGAAVPAGAVEVGRTPSAVVYDVPPVVDPAVVFTREVISTEATSDGAGIRWLGPNARLDVVSTDPGLYAVRITVVSYETTREVRFAGSAVRVSPFPVDATVCVRTEPGGDGVALGQAVIEVDRPLVAPGLEARGVGIGIVQAQADSTCR